MKIAITGGIGSGKSTVARVARDMGFKVASCDDTYARLCRDADFLRELGALFPAAVKGEPPALDRRALAEEVFSSDARRALLNDFTHPRIMAAMEKEIGGGTAFYEVPLLFESGLKGCFDEIIVVLREKNARMAAVAARSGLTEEQIKARMRAQIDYDAFDFSGCRILRNDGDIETLRARAKELIAALTAGAV